MSSDATALIVIGAIAILGVILTVTWEEISYRRCKRRCTALEKEVKALQRNLKKSQEQVTELTFRNDDLLSQISELTETVRELKGATK